MDHLHLFKVFSCRGSRYLAERIASHLGSPLGLSSVTVFSDGEFQPAFDESVRGATVFIIQSTFLRLTTCLNSSLQLMRLKELRPTR
jgi:ribose-phosphate pyrophosphokinase